MDKWPYLTLKTHGNPSHLRATRRHLLYGITQCYPSPDTSELVLPNPSQTGWYSIYLPRRDGRLGWPGWLVTYQNGLHTRGVADLSKYLPGPVSINYIDRTQRANLYTMPSLLVNSTTAVKFPYISRFSDKWSPCHVRQFKNRTVFLTANNEIFDMFLVTNQAMHSESNILPLHQHTWHHYKFR